MKRLLVSTCLVGGLIVLGAPAAHAGEITGNGKATPVRDHVAHSICAFSGLDDEDDDGFGRTQNWGSLPKEVRAFLATVGEHPGHACRGNLQREE